MIRFLLILFFLIPSISFPASISIQLHQVRVADLARVVYGDVLRQSYVLDQEILQSSDVVSVNWMRLTSKELEALTIEMLNLRGFELVKQGRVSLVRKREDQDQDLLIYEPRNRSARYLSDILAKIANVQQLGSRKMEMGGDFAAAAAKQPDQVGSVGATVSQSASDQLAYQCMPQQCVRLRKLLVDLDTPEAQVVLRAAVYEVGTTKGEGSAIQIAAKLFQGNLIGTTGSALAGASQLHLAAPNLDVVLSALDQDGRFKSISRPMLRVKTGSQAKFSVGQQVPILGTMSLDKNGNTVQSVEYRQSGTIFTVQPDVRLDVVDLNVTQELSSFVATTTGVNGSPTMLQRMATSQLTIKPGEVIVFAGLEEAKDDEADSHLFGFSLGKKKNSTSSEVLLFIEAQRI